MSDSDGGPSKDIELQKICAQIILSHTVDILADVEKATKLLSTDTAERPLLNPDKTTLSTREREVRFVRDLLLEVKGLAQAVQQLPELLHVTGEFRLVCRKFWHRLIQYLVRSVDALDPMSPNKTYGVIKRLEKVASLLVGMRFYANDVEDVGCANSEVARRFVRRVLGPAHDDKSTPVCAIPAPHISIADQTGSTPARSSNDAMTLMQISKLTGLPKTTLRSWLRNDCNFPTRVNSDGQAHKFLWGEFQQYLSRRPTGGNSRQRGQTKSSA